MAMQSKSNTRSQLGDPYQIYTEVVNAGKNVSGSKKKIRWLFSFTESETEYEIILILSVLSGKKSIYEDGREVVSVASVLNTDFSHGWSSFSTQRLYRVEVNVTYSAELLYVFSIDGVPFVDLPQKPNRPSRIIRNRDSNAGTGRYSLSDEPSYRDSETNNNNNLGAKRSSFNTSGTNSTQSTPANRNNNQQQQQRASATTRTSTSNAAAATSTGSEGFDNDPFASGNKNNSSNNGFDPFADDFGASPAAPTPTPTAAAVAAKKASPMATNNNTSTAPTPTSAAVAARRASTTAATAAAVAASKPPAAPTTTVVNLFDEVSEPSSASNNTSNNQFDAFSDNFASTKAVTPSAAAPGRRSSAAEISQDLAGLSFSAPAHAPAVQAAKKVEAAPAPIVEQVAAEPAAPVDPWQTNLVDLDLSGRTAVTRRASSTISAGPSLDSLAGNNHNGMRRGSMANNSGYANGGGQTSLTNPTGLLASLNDPFGAPPVLQTTPMHANQQHMGGGGYQVPVPNMPRPLTSADAISHLGQQQAPPPGYGGMRGSIGGGGMLMMPPQPPQYGMGLQSGAPRTPMAGNGMMMGGGGGGMMGGNGMMGGGGGMMAGGSAMQSRNHRGSITMPSSSSTMMSSSTMNNNQSKSSLDSLDWRTMN